MDMYSQGFNVLDRFFNAGVSYTPCEPVNLHHCKCCGLPLASANCDSCDDGPHCSGCCPGKNA